MKLSKISACATAGFVLTGSMTLGAVLLPSASAALHAGKMDGHTFVGPTGNIVEVGDPGLSTYVPNVDAASTADRAKAQRLLDGANHFCATHTASGIEARWNPGTGKAMQPTHYFNPNSSWGLHVRQPRAALIYGGKLGGVMFSGMPLPYLGSIPRAHTHMMGSSMEMVHVYCDPSLKEAFTPNRVLGVLAETIALRLKIRPAVMDLTRHQLREVRAKVRAYAGAKLQPVAPSGSSTGSGPDPVLRAMRIEIRRSLMILNEKQLRSVWRLMLSYPSVP